MSTGLNVNGVDLDTIFAAIGGTSKGADVGIKVGGSDISNRYCASTGGDQIGYNTNYLSNGTDLRYKFRDINYVSGTAPTITGGSVTTSSYSINVTNVLYLDVTATGTAPLSYQWYKNGSPIGGATGASYSKTTTSPSDSGTYSVTVSNANGSASRGSSITVSDIPPVINGGTVTGGPYNFVVGAVAQFTVTIAAGTNVSYQWYKNGTPIGGATGTSYTIGSCAVSDTAAYGVQIVNSAGNATTGTYLTVRDIAPSITGGTVTGGPYTLNTGNVAAFTVSATGTNLTYQWYKDGSPIGGATGSGYTIGSCQPSDSGSYLVSVSNSAGNAQASASLTVN